MKGHDHRDLGRTWYGCPPDKIDEFKQSLATRTGNPVHEWECPCGCEVKVFYSPEMNPLGTGESGVCFCATHCFSMTSGTIHIDNVEDFDALMSDERMDELDRLLYAVWLAAGLRDVLLGAIK